MKTTVFCATSLDGFLARSDGDVSWLGDPSDGEDDGGFSALMESIDYLVMGRNTFDKVLSFEAWPYSKPVVVLTSRPLDLSAELSQKVEPLSGGPSEITAALTDRGAKHLYLDGGKTIQAFLSAGLIQEIIVTTIPILLGSGISLFGQLDADIHLQHVETRTLAGGLVQSKYQVIR